MHPRGLLQAATSDDDAWRHLCILTILRNALKATTTATKKKLTSATDSFFVCMLLLVSFLMAYMYNSNRFGFWERLIFDLCVCVCLLGIIMFGFYRWRTLTQIQATQKDRVDIIWKLQLFGERLNESTRRHEEVINEVWERDAYTIRVSITAT